MYGLASKEQIKCLLFTIVNKRRLGIGPNTALSIDWDFDLLENVNVLSSTLVKFYRAMPPLSRVELWPNRIDRFRSDTMDQ